jgi:hypothetical protein
MVKASVSWTSETPLGCRASLMSSLVTTGPSLDPDTTKNTADLRHHLVETVRLLTEPRLT